MKITVLGSASGISMRGRGHTSVALESGNGLYVLDLGEPVGRELLARGLPVEHLKAAFVSHMHSDHAGGLFQFVKNLHLYHNHPDYLPQVEEFVLALPAEAVEAVKAFMIASYMFPERTNVKVNYVEITEGRCYEDENITVDAFGTSHFGGLTEYLAGRGDEKGPRGEAFGFEIRGEDRRVVYSGDLGGIDDILGRAAGADLLILEFGHLIPLEDNLRKLAGLGTRKIILTHIFPDYNEKTRELQETADAVLPGVVTVAEDGLVFGL